MRCWAYPEEVRMAAVTAYLNGLGTLEQVSGAFECSSASLKRWLAKHRRGDSLAPSTQRGHRLPMLTEKEMARLRDLVDAQNDLTLDRLVELLAEDTGVVVSRSTVMRSLWRLGYSLKKRRFVQVKRTSRGFNNSGKTSSGGSRSKLRSTSSTSTSPAARSR